jgi:hypothetical protein
MPNDLSSLLRGLEQLRQLGPQGALEGLQTKAALDTEAMRQTNAHGDQTGATRASYFAAAVGLGETSAAQVAASRASVEALNPGHVGTGAAEVEGIGIIYSSGTNYQDDLETENAAEKAVLAPTLQAEYLADTAAAARGSKQRLG